MNVPEIIERKREGGETTFDELKALLGGVVDESVPLYQVSAWLMAVLFRGMTAPETANFTRLMMESGDVLELSMISGVKVDKHSTGGVGDKISIPLAPLVAAAGVRVPMISGRGLGHTGGTLDKLESIPGLRTDLDENTFRDLVERVGFSIISSSANVAPADRKLYALRDVTGTVPSIPLITGSILSKKFAAGVDALVLDVKSGSGAFMRTHEDALELARTLVSVCGELGKRATAFVTAMDQPLGVAVGNALEMRESIDVLRGEGPADILELVMTLGSEMVVFAGLEPDRPRARARLESVRSSGAGLEKFREWVQAQHGDPAYVDAPDKLPQAPHVTWFECPREGWLAGWDTREIGFAANALGAGRKAVGDAIDPAVGFRFPIDVGTRVEAGQPLVEIHAGSEAAATQAAKRLAACVTWADEAPPVRPLVLDDSITTN